MHIIPKLNVAAAVSVILLACIAVTAASEDATRNHGLVGLRPLPRYAEDLKSNHGGPWAGLPTFVEQKGQYPFVSEHLDVVKGWLDGDFKTKRVFFEHYWGLSAARDNLDPEKNLLVKVIAHWESKGGIVEHILICREYRLAIHRGHPDAKPGPFSEDTRILSEKDVDDIRALFRNAHEKGLLKRDNYKLIQMVEEPSFFADDARVHPIIDKMEGMAYEAHQFNRHWPLETGWSKPEKVIKGAKWTLAQGKEYIFYYGPVIWKSEQYYEFIERDWLCKYWEAGLPKHHPRMHYYLNTFPHAHGRGRPIGPETDPHSVLGLTKWLIREIKMRPEEKSESTRIKDIKAYCIDFNWGDGGPNGFAKPGLWADADPAKHVAWYKAMGANVIQTFAVSCNGYAWYKNGKVPEQPGLKHDFLPEMVRLGHKEGLLVMGYFCIGANTKWGLDHPELSYGTPANRHIPFTDEYLAYLSMAIGDAVRKTGIDGFMIDWFYQPERKNWKECEKVLYEQLMGEAYPGDGKLSKEKEIEYSRKAIDRTWTTIRTAAKDANPECIVWLTAFNPTHPHIVNSRMYKEVDWLMNEGGDLERIMAVEPMIGKHTRLITCLANWNKQDATSVVPAALKAGIGLYGFAKPGDDSLLPLEELLKRPVTGLNGDDRNIAVLARAYHGAPINSVMNDKGEFVETTK